jgi:hypothetical protein
VCSEPTQEMERSADVLSAGLLEVANPSLSSRYFLKQVYLLYETPATFYFMSHTSYIFFFLYGLHCEFNRVFLCHWQHWTDGQDDVQDSMKHKPLWESYMPKNKKDKRGTGKNKYGSLYRTYGTRVIPV